MKSALMPLILGNVKAEERAMDEVELRGQLERAHADCFGWAMACCGRNRDDAEEVLQTVYLTVLDGRARYDGRSTFRTWLFGVIRRTAASERRKTWLRGLLLEREAGRGKREAGRGTREAGVIAPDPFAPPDAEVEHESRRDGLRHALGQLAKRQCEVLQLVFYHDLTVEEAAAVMHVSVGSARTHYARGKANLAAMLGGAKEL
jgi:RNA polymerase sigma factor (sigma-70 family)